MGCNCNKADSTPLSVKKENRKKLKDRILEMKRLWEESKTTGSSGTATASKEELGFK